MFPAPSQPEPGPHVFLGRGAMKGMDKVTLQHQNGFTAEILRYGGQVISWSKGGEQFLFASSNAIINERESLFRGGIPICFPEFSIPGNHGFVGNKVWGYERSYNLPRRSANALFEDLILDYKDCASDHKFEFRLRIALQDDEKLVLTSRIRNVSDTPFEFKFAYHTYLAVSDISEVSIEGLEKTRYWDNLKKRFTDRPDAITFDSEVERVYDAPASNNIRVVDHVKKRSYVISQQGLRDVVVWNPWDEKSRSMPKPFAEDEYKKMVCVSPAIQQIPKPLMPGEEWTGIMELSVVNSTDEDDDMTIDRS